MLNGGDGPLVAALRNDPVVGPRALEMLKRPGTFKADDEEARAFFVIFSQVFFGNKNIIFCQYNNEQFR